MRILYISNSTGGGGAPASLYNLIEGLACRHKIGVVLPQASGDLYDKLQDLGVKIYDSVPYVLDIWPKTYNPFRFISKCIKLCKNRSSVRSYIGSIIDDFHPDIVHTNVGPLSIGVEETIKRGIPHVWHMREYQDKDFSMTFFPSRRAFINLIHSDNNHNISITQDIFRHWNLRTGKDIVVYNAIRRVPDKPVTESADKGYFLYVGRIEKSKGLMTLLKAFKQYKMLRGANNLLVAGRPCGFYALWCKLYVMLFGLSSSVDFLGPRNDVHSLMAAADAFVMTSYSEGFGLTTAEAMINRCVVIGRDTAGTKEQFDRGVEVTGSEIALRFNDGQELLACLEYVSDAKHLPELQALKTRAESVASTSYTAERYVMEIENYYKSILGL